MKYVDHLPVDGKTVFLRVDFNVPLREGKVEDDTRIRAALPTINYLLQRRAKLVLASHLGRPRGKVVKELSLKPVAEHLGKLLGRPVKFSPQTVGEEADRMKEQIKEGDVLLLENLRFNPGETKDDVEFASQLARGIEVYVNDAFGTCHRAHASVHALAKLISVKGAGFLIKKEVENLSKALLNPSHPYVLIVGGAKVSDKIPVLENLMGHADRVLVGGAMAYTFLKALGRPVGDSLVEEERLEDAERILREAEERGIEFLLPRDHRCVREIKPGAEMRIMDEIESGWKGVDIGPETEKIYREKITDAATVVWNGPMGIFEIEEFSHGTVAVARAVAESSAFSVVGGGDSASAVKKAGVSDKISHISTGGGASLEFLSGKPLPGLQALEEK